MSNYTDRKSRRDLSYENQKWLFNDYQIHRSEPSTIHDNNDLKINLI